MVWKEASPFGIEKDAGQDAWYSGHVTDVIEQEDESLVIATETGGVWLVGANGSALPLSDSWDSPDVNCLARGPDGTRHYYAGANDGTIWQTDPAAGFPMFNWAPVVGTPAPQGSVRDLAVIPTLRLIIAACDQGVFWANIPPVATAPYIWREALYKDSIDPTGFFSVTMGLTDWPDRIPVTEGPDGFLLDQTHLDYVTVTAGGQSRGMFSGQWKGAPGTLRDLPLRPVRPAGHRRHGPARPDEVHRRRHVRPAAQRRLRRLRERRRQGEHQARRQDRGRRPDVARVRRQDRGPVPGRRRR